jgi:hypothetical protein
MSRKRNPRKKRRKRKSMKKSPSGSQHGEKQKAKSLRMVEIEIGQLQH